MVTAKEWWYINHQDTDPPLSILNEYIDSLCRLVLKSKNIPFWVTREQAISQTIREIKATLDDIEKHGNKWVYEEAGTPWPILFMKLLEKNMANELINRIKDYVVSWDNTVNDFTSMADYDFWLEAAINLLEETIGENK